MKNETKWIVAGSVLAILVVATLLVLAILNSHIKVDVSAVPEMQQPLENNLGGSAIGSATNVFGSASSPIYMATTTATSTTDSIALGFAVDVTDLNIWSIASSTTAQIKYQLEFSNDGIYWFGEDVKSTAGVTVTHQTGSTTHQWIPGSTVATGRNIQVSSIASKYMRIRLFRGKNSRTAANNFSVWVEKAVKINR